MDSDVRSELYKELSKYVQFIGAAILGLFGYLLKLRFENSIKDVEPYMIIVVFITIGLFILGSVFLVLGAKSKNKTSE